METQGRGCSLREEWELGNTYAMVHLTLPVSFLLSTLTHLLDDRRSRPRIFLSPRTAVEARSGRMRGGSSARPFQQGLIGLYPGCAIEG